jgi:hypothetical protein
MLPPVSLNGLIYSTSLNVGCRSPAVHSYALTGERMMKQQGAVKELADAFSVVVNSPVQLFRFFPHLILGIAQKPCYFRE